ncbi:MAG: UDP-N-acetylmuramate dehydrogenase [Clostridiales bacterium]|nr:UDP-N-acetylmuramate dehydrogenase [Clostridiales bacterium]
MNKLPFIIEFCEKSGIKHIESPSLREMTSFRTGGTASISLHPDSEEKLQKCVLFLNENKIKTFVLGKGTNVLALDEGFDGAVLSMSDYCGIRLIEEDVIECAAGTSLIQVCRFARDNSFEGLEFAFGIPGSVGGAVYMNAGAYGGEIKDVFLKSTHILPDGRNGAFTRNEAKLSYRHSAYYDTAMVISKVYFKLKKGDPEQINQKMEELMQRRRDKQPLEYPSAGSTFKRPEGYFAGALIEKSALKGFGIGGAYVSQKHAGFIINKDNASSADILSLVDYCQKKVLTDSGVLLEPEIRVLR